MPRRVKLPGASELFRASSVPTNPEHPQDDPAAVPSPEPDDTGQASGRVRHDEKITVYVSSTELLAVEQARLTLRAAGIAVDRGRLVRAAIAVALADLADQGLDADVVGHLGA